jgi:hypothetical protein
VVGLLVLARVLLTLRKEMFASVRHVRVFQRVSRLREQLLVVLLPRLPQVAILLEPVQPNQVALNRRLAQPRLILQDTFILLIDIVKHLTLPRLCLFNQ